MREVSQPTSATSSYSKQQNMRSFYNCFPMPHRILCEHFYTAAKSPSTLQKL